MAQNYPVHFEDAVGYLLRSFSEEEKKELATAFMISPMVRLEPDLFEIAASDLGIDKGNQILLENSAKERPDLLWMVEEDSPEREYFLLNVLTEARKRLLAEKQS